MNTEKTGNGIKKIADAIARDLAERSFMSIEDTAMMISMKMKDGLRALAKDLELHEEAEHAKLVEKAGKLAGSSEYLAFCNKVSAAKAKAKRAGALHREARRQDNYKALLAYVEKNFGTKAVDRFLMSIEKEDGHYTQ